MASEPFTVGVGDLLIVEFRCYLCVGRRKITLKRMAERMGMGICQTIVLDSLCESGN